jgi:hypothetical protein
VGIYCPDPRPYFDWRETIVKILPDIEAIPTDRLPAFIKSKATYIVNESQGAWLEETGLQSATAEEALLGHGLDLAHACYRLIRAIESQGMIIKT